MQKKLIALAVAGLASGAAFAQSNVTIYGALDVYAGMAKADNATGNQKQTFVNASGINGSRIGFRGEEALGNGLSAVYQLELGSLTLDSATNGIGTTRQSYVGLKSDKLGQLHMGRLQTVNYYWASKYDPMNIASSFSLMLKSASFTGSGSFLGTSLRVDNGVAYISPRLSGFQVSANYAVGEQVTGTSGSAGYSKAQTFYNLGLDYEKGPLSAGLVYAEMDDKGGVKNGVASTYVKEWGLGAKYDLGFVKPHVTYQEATDRLTASLAEWKQKQWNVGVHIPVFGKDTLKLAYNNVKSNQANAPKAQGYVALYIHPLSKRTNVYAAFQTFHNGTYAAVGTFGDPSPSAGRNASAYAIGMNHSF